MPITPLHFGVNGTISSIAPSRVYMISCLLANVLLDIQPSIVIFFSANIQLHGISHTLPFAIIACTLFFTFYGLVMKNIFHTKKPLSAFLLGGVIGGILHVLLDSFYHSDVRPFYPFSSANFAQLGGFDNILRLCLFGYMTFIFALIIRYFLNKFHFR